MLDHPMIFWVNISIHHNAEINNSPRQQTVWRSNSHALALTPTLSKESSGEACIRLWNLWKEGDDGPTDQLSLHKHRQTGGGGGLCIAFAAFCAWTFQQQYIPLPALELFIHLVEKVLAGIFLQVCRIYLENAIMPGRCYCCYPCLYGLCPHGKWWNNI